MVKTARLVWGYVRHNLMSAMAYRGAFFLQVFGMVLNDAMLLFFWWVLFSRLPTLQGWDLAGVMTLYGVVAFGFGVANVVCGNAFLVARAVVKCGLGQRLGHFVVSLFGRSTLGLSYSIFLVDGLIAPSRRNSGRRPHQSGVATRKTARPKRRSPQAESDMRETSRCASGSAGSAR